MEKVIIFGIGDISQIAYLYLSENKNYEIVAFTIDKEYIKEDTFLGLPVVAFENLEDEKFVEYINEIIKDFPEYDFKALYFDKNSIKEIKNKFQHSNLNLIELKSAKDIFENLEVYLSNELINLIDTKIIRYLRQLSQEIFPLSLNLYHPKNMNLKTFEMNNISYFNKFFINLEYLCFEQSNIEKYGNSFHEIYFKKACEKYGIDLEIDLNETLSKAYVYWNLKLGLSNHEFFKSSLEFGKKFATLQS